MRRATPTTRGKGAADYRLAAFLLALLLGVSNRAAAAPSRAEFAQRLSGAPYACSGETARRMLSRFMEHAKGRRDGIIVANWYLDPDGFAFQIPEGLSPADVRQSRSFLNLFSANRSVLSLVDASQENTAYSTNFELTISSEDKRLKTMQWEEAERAFSGRVERFLLLHFARVIVCEEDGVRLTYLMGKSPRLQVQHCMFVKNGKTYVMTMASENRMHALPDAWQQFDTIYSTFFFLEDTSGGE